MTRSDHEMSGGLALMALLLALGALLWALSQAHGTGRSGTLVIRLAASGQGPAAASRALPGAARLAGAGRRSGAGHPSPATAPPAPVAPATAGVPDGAAAMIDVAVATLWAQPGHTRPLDRPSLANPVDLNAWGEAMSYEQRLWLVGRLVDQALYGEEVVVRRQRGSWEEIAIPDPYAPGGFGDQGWVPARQLVAADSATTAALIDDPTALLRARTTLLRPQGPRGEADGSAVELSFDTRLPVLGEHGSWITVLTPDGATARIARAAATVLAPGTLPARPTGGQIVATAERFLGIRYLWAGTSAFAFDCSGFSYTIYDSFGLRLPRNAAGQAQVGTPVTRRALRPGDLVFFATDPPSRAITHVAIYIGGGRIIEAPNSSGSVQITPLADRSAEYVTARRYLGS